MYPRSKCKALQRLECGLMKYFGKSLVLSGNSSQISVAENGGKLGWEGNWSKIMKKFLGLKVKALCRESLRY